MPREHDHSYFIVEVVAPPSSPLPPSTQQPTTLRYAHTVFITLSLSPSLLYRLYRPLFLSGRNCLAFACTHPNCFFLLLESRSAVSIPRHCAVAYLSNVSFIRKTSRHESLKRVSRVFESRSKTNESRLFFDSLLRVLYPNFSKFSKIYRNTKSPDYSYIEESIILFLLLVINSLLRRKRL